jgi:hypothetical protein
MGADAGRNAPVQVPAHRHLLAGRLGVHVHQHVVRAATQVRQHGVGFGERRTRGFQVEHPGKVHDAKPAPVLLDDREAAAGCGLRVVRRAHDAFVAIEQLVDVAVPERVVAERDRVGAGVEQRGGDLRRDADAARGVLAVDHDEVRRLGFDQPGQQRFHDRAAGRADDVTDEEDLHAS